MALHASYKLFLASPTSSALATDASLHYITTTTSHSGHEDVIKHLGTTRNQINKKKEEIISAIEDRDALAVEVDTTLEFATSGGPYLPGLDDNFLADRTVNFSVIHLVAFDGEGKITQIRQSWDQGAVLKQLDVIGKTGRNWPIRDSKDQLRLIATCIKATGAVPAAGSTEALPVRSRNDSNILRDPHASLSLFAPAEEKQQLASTVVSPYAGSRPPQRDITDILGDQPSEESSPSSGRQRPDPSRVLSPKSGVKKSLQPIRLFETDDNGNEPTNETAPVKSKERSYRPHPQKYQHFDFADGTDPQDAPSPGQGLDKKPKTKKDASWSFEDFVTPQKAKASRGLHRHQDVRHWGTEKDEVEVTPVPRKEPIKPRPDTETHFDFVDDGPAGEPRPSRPRGTAHNNGLGLYENNLYNEDGTAPTPGPGPLSNITNVKDRRKDFEAHFSFDDESPPVAANVNTKVGHDRQQAVRMMAPNWSSYDVSPQKENSNPSGRRTTEENHSVVVAGDGMGGGKTSGGGRGWAIGDESDEELSARKMSTKQSSTTKSDFWDF